MKIQARIIQGTDKPVTVEPLWNKRVALAGLNVVGRAVGPAGVAFILAGIREKCDMAGNIDACLCVGNAVGINPSIDRSVFFWDGRFWMMAVDKLGVSYYRDKCYALYEIEVANPEFMESLGGL